MCDENALKFDVNALSIITMILEMKEWNYWPIMSASVLNSMVLSHDDMISQGAFHAVRPEDLRRGVRFPVAMDIA